MMQWRERTVRFGIPVLGFFGVILAITNPPQEAYLDYATQRLAEDVKTGICSPNNNLRQVLGGAADLITGVCRTGVDTQRQKIRDYLKNASSRNNWVLFSIYKTDILDKRYTTLALLGNFVTSTQKAK